jgi:hypothetical protein
LDLFAFSHLAVLTVEGEKSVALFKGGAAALLDGVHYTFESRDQLIAFLLERFSSGSFSFCLVRRRKHRLPRTFYKQSEAFAHVDRLPRGFYYIFARDLNKNGMKEFQVAGLADFYDFFSKLEPKRRMHYDIARANTPVTLYMDLEFELFAGRNVGKNGRQMLKTLIRLVAQVWAEEKNVAVEDFMPGFAVTDSSTGMEFQQEEEVEEEEAAAVDIGGAIPMEMEPTLPLLKPLQKVSFHVHNQLMWFPSGPTAGGRFHEACRTACRGQSEPFYLAQTQQGGRGAEILC